MPIVTVVCLAALQHTEAVHERVLPSHQAGVLIQSARFCLAMLA
jgi:hypothetical protein